MSDRSHRVADEAHLRRFAELELFWILRPASVQKGGLIHYLDPHGAAMILMDDDDDRVARCIRLLEAIGCQVFHDTSAMEEHAQEMARRRRVS